MEPEPYISLDQVCEYLGVNKQWISEAEKRGFPVRRLSSRMLRTKVSWVEEWLDRQQQAS